MKKISSYLCYGFIILIGILDIIYGIYFEYTKCNFKSNASKVDANIYAIVKRKDNKRLLYVNFYVKDKMYDGVLLSNDKALKTSDKIVLYYNKSNPKEFINGDIIKTGWYIIIMGVFISLLGIVLILNYYQNYTQNKLKNCN